PAAHGVPSGLGPPAHTPALHASVSVHSFPSSHAVPSIFAGYEQIPFTGLHAPGSWHASGAAHISGLAPVQTPALQVSLCVHASPSSQAAPFGLTGFPHMPVCGSQTPTSWQASLAAQTTGF